MLMNQQAMQGVLILSEVRGDTRRYRALHLVEQLKLIGIPSRFVQMADPQALQIAKQPWAIAIFQRVGYGRHVDKICKTLADRGTMLLVDFDDLIFDLSAFPYINSPDFSDPVRVRLYKENMLNNREMLDRSEASLASTNFLAERIRQAGKVTWVHRNGFSLEMFAYSEAARLRKTKRSNERVIIGYASGTPTHNRDFELIKPALIKIMRQYPQVELRLIGPIDPGGGWAGISERISQHNLVPWRKLPELLAELDINIAPLFVDNPFSQSKSEIKYMEAAMVETPTVASDTDAFRYAIQHGETGFLAETHDQWVEALSKLIDNLELRTVIARHAYEEVVRSYHPARRADQLSSLLENISMQLRGESFWKTAQPTREALALKANQLQDQQYRLPFAYEQPPSLIEMGFYSLRNRGLITLLKHMWIYFRRSLSPLFPF